MIVLIPVTAILLTWIWFEVWRMTERWQWLQFKPFDCEMCFCMWMAAALYLCPVFIQELLFVTSTAAGIGAWVSTKK